MSSECVVEEDLHSNYVQNQLSLSIREVWKGAMI